MANKLSRHFIKKRVLVVVEFHLSSQIFGSYLGRTEHLHPGRRFPRWESPASRNSSYHEASCQGTGKSFLKKVFVSYKTDLKMMIPVR